MARKRIKVSFALRFYSEVFGLDHLHYGLWEDEPLTFEGLRCAQERYAERLAGLIPEGVETVLDVGCGTGSFSAALLGRGYRVEGLSPDPHQQKLYGERVGEPFHLVRFQDFEVPHLFDLVVMSESVQYIWLPSYFPAVRRTVRAGGHLLLADYFRVRRDDGELPGGSGHDLEAFLAKAQEAGLKLVHREDVTEQVLPTLDLGRDWMEKHLDPFLALMNDSLTERFPRIYGLLRFFLRRRAERELGKIRELLDGEEFQRTRRYLILLYQVTGKA